MSSSGYVSRDRASCAWIRHGPNKTCSVLFRLDVTQLVLCKSLGAHCGLGAVFVIGIGDFRALFVLVLTGNSWIAFRIFVKWKLGGPFASHGIVVKVNLINLPFILITLNVHCIKRYASISKGLLPGIELLTVFTFYFIFRSTHRISAAVMFGQAKQENNLF